MFLEALSCRHDDHALCLQPLFSFGRMGSGVESFKLLVMAWPFWWLAPIQELFHSLRRVTSLEQKALLSPRKFQGIYLCVRTPSHIKCWDKRCSYHIGNYKSLRSWVPRTQGRPILYTFSVTSQSTTDVSSFEDVDSTTTQILTMPRSAFLP